MALALREPPYNSTERPTPLQQQSCCITGYLSWHGVFSLVSGLQVEAQVSAAGTRNQITHHGRCEAEWKMNLTLQCSSSEHDVVEVRLFACLWSHQQEEDLVEQISSRH